MTLLRRAAQELRGWTEFRLPANFFGDWGTSSETYAGVTVSQSTAMTCSAVYAAVSLISETIATLPSELVQRYGDGSRYARPKPLWMQEPNPVTGLDWIGLLQQMLTSLLLDGNSFTGVVRVPGSMEPASLWPLDPTRVVIETDKNGTPSYRVGDRTLQRGDVLHIRGLTMPGSLRGLSPVELARQSLGRTFAAEKFASKMFVNMAVPGTVITAAQNINDEQAKRLSERWDNAHRGLENVFKTVVLGNGASVQVVSLTPEQVQMLETMRYGILDVARWYRIPPYMLDPSVSSTWGTGIAEQNIQTKQYTLNPWAVRLQDGLGRLIFDTYQDPAYTLRFDFRSFLKGDPVKQATYLETKMRCKAMTPNEWRALDDENPLPDGTSTLDSVQWQADQPVDVLPNPNDTGGSQ